MNYETSIDTSNHHDLGGHDLAGPVGAGGNGLTGPAPSRRNWLIGGGLVLAVIAVVGFSMAGKKSTAPEAGAAAAQMQAVSVVMPGVTTVSRTISASGILAARRNMPVGVAGEGGQVLSVLVEAGQWVNAGQVLAVVDRSVQSQQLSGQAANIEVQRANLRLAEANLDRALKLVGRGFISRADVDRLTATRDSAAAQVRVAQAQLGQLRASAARLNVIAPAGGFVLARNVEPGQVVGPGSGVLFQIAKGGEMELQARVDEADLAQLGTGTTAEVKPVGTDTAFTGQIWQLAPTIDAQTRQGTARIALAYNAALRPGGFATANIRGGTVTAPILPESAVQHDAKGDYVYVVGGNNKVARREVKLGQVSEKGIAIVGGLAGNEHVVLRAGGFLSPGDTVKPSLVKNS